MVSGIERLHYKVLERLLSLLLQTTGYCWVVLPGDLPIRDHHWNVKVIWRPRENHPEGVFNKHVTMSNVL